MKLSITPAESTTFKPVAVTFICDTQKELDALGSLFNCSPVVDTLATITGNPVAFYHIFKTNGANISQATMIANKLREHFFQ